MAGHRYWRLYFDSSNSGNISSSLIEFRETVGGPSICTGGVGYASSTVGGFDANAVFAGTAQWASNGGAPQWIAYDLGVGVTHDVAEVAYKSRTDGFTNQTPNTAHLEFSDDNVTWNVASSEITYGPTGSWSVGETKLYTVTPPPPLQASRLSLYVTEGTPNNANVSRVSLYAVEGPPVQLFASRLSLYVVEGPPGAPPRRLGPSVF